MRIVESRTPLWKKGEEWKLGAAPTLAIGEHPAGPNDEFTSIKRTFTLPDGRIAVVNTSRPPEIRLFDASGKYQSTIGHMGSGPGEIRLIWDAWFIRPDTILVFDASNARMTYFDVAGAPARMVTFEQKGSQGLSAIPYARFSDGTFLLRRNRFIDAAIKEGNGRTMVPAVRTRDDGTVVDTIGTFADADYVTTPSWGPNVPRFGRFAVLMAHDTFYYRGMGDDYTVDVYTVHGRHLLSMRHPAQPRAVTASLLDQLKQHDVDAAAPERRAAIEKDYADKPHTATLPAYGNVWVVDADNDLWVQDFTTAVDTDGPWSVFDGQGRWLGTVHMPANFRPEEIGRDYVLGVWRNELDVESVRRFPLLRKAG